MGLDFDASGFFRRRHAVLESILDERLKNEIRHESVARPFVDAQRDLQLSLKAHFHDVEISLQQLELPIEWHLLFRRLLERVTQQFAQSRDHATNALWVALDEARDGVK